MAFPTFIRRGLIDWLRVVDDANGAAPSDRVIATKYNLDLDRVGDLLAELEVDGLIRVTDGPTRVISILVPRGTTIPSAVPRAPKPARITVLTDPPAEAEALSTAAPERSPPPVEAAAPIPQAEPLPETLTMAAPATVADIAHAFAGRGRHPRLAAAIDRANDPTRPAAPLFEPGRKPHVGADIIRAAKAENRELFEFCSALLRIGFVEWKLSQEAGQA